MEASMTLVEWKAYFPDDGETAEDATTIIMVKPWARACDVAEDAVEYDFSSRDGWERSEAKEFPVVVISPTGEETRYVGWHEPSVVHKVRKAV
jgi:hypothetical protein